MSPTRRPSVIESPWYWVHLFGVAGIVALALMGPKFAARQTQLEQNFQGRVRANQAAVGETPSGKISTPNDTIITLTPLYIVAGLIAAFGWVMLWLKHFRKRRSVDSEENFPPAKEQLANNQSPIPN